MNTNATLAAITAAGIVYNADDYTDPHLTGPTALTVTADGRVFGHLAKWGTCHIGYGDQCVQPPTSAQGYKYFHQGVVPTDKGDLPVGKITMGTGHAAINETSSVAAAAHYDNTGTAVATVRAGEDQYGIWVAGRLVPGVDEQRVDELRRSGISGDWRGIDGHHELVAALAVNVPGFPVPRTEQLVAGGGLALVAAGVVLRPEDMMPKTPDQLAAVIAAAIVADTDKKANAAKRAALTDKVKAVADASAGARRDRAAGRVAALRKGRANDKVLTAAGLHDATGTMPHQLKTYWTKGAGLARWAAKPHPWQALVNALREEVPGKSAGWYQGLASNLFHSAMGYWPGDRKGSNPVGPGSGAMVAAAPAFLKHDDKAVPPKAVKPKKKPAVAPPAVDDKPKPDTPDAPPADDRFPPKQDDKDDNPKDTDTPDAPDVDAKPAGSPPPRKSGLDHNAVLEDEVPDTGAHGGKLVSFSDGIATYDDGSQTDGKEWSDTPKKKVLDRIAAAGGGHPKA